MAFRNRKNKTVSMDNQMEKQGIDPEKIKQSIVGKSKKPTNDIYSSSNFRKQKICKSDWIRFLTQMDMRQWCSILLWENVPNGIPSWMINQMAYYRGSLAGFIYNKGFYILPYTMKGGLNPYGLPTGITPVSYNGTVDNKSNAFEKGFSCNINNAGNYDENATSVIYYCTMPIWASGIPVAPYITNLVVIEQMAEILSRIVIQVVSTTPKFIFKTQDPKQQEILLEQLQKAFDSESPFIVVVDENLNTIELQPNTNTNASDLWIHFKGFVDLKNASNGVENGGYFQKKERKNVSESDSDTVSTSLCLTDRLYFAKEFVSQLKKQFGDPTKPNYIEGMELMTVRFNDELDVREGIDDEGNQDDNDNQDESVDDDNVSE